MSLLSAQMSSRTIVSIIFTCLVLAILLVFLVLWILWKKNKLKGGLDFFMGKAVNILAITARQTKAKFLKTRSKGELALYWTTISSGLLCAIFLLAFEISMGYYSLGFLRSLFFIIMLIYMITFNSRHAAVEPYYYELNYMLFFYSAISLFFAVLDFFMAVGSVASLGIAFPMFIGNLLFYGTIFVTRYAKKEFKPRDIFVYVGAIILIIMHVVDFALSSFHTGLEIVFDIFALIHNISIMILLTFFYDGFSFVKRMFRRR